ncbi:hypothetical protein NCG89_14195 [Spongiibacter taiwanensis]|uniref:IucA/IucC family protein n=1 Tax=Spongiibacter taiwanensis TaxID=1748242 RepID=UPI0020357D8B|nr:IucA/IucC family protein [Spongiibacter taiwanensis]USA42682.1 hypothetical protein NCG89_14195 [Spongiibacter taiwanensis]
MLHSTVLAAADLAKGVHALACADLKPYLALRDGVDDSERRVLRQLTEALLFEGIVAFQQIPLAEAGIASDGVNPVYDCALLFELSGCRFRCIGSRRVFDRIRIASGSVACETDAGFREAGLLDLLGKLEMDAGARQRVLGELSQTIALCRWNADNLSHHLSPRRGLGFQALESAITEGHLYHPSFKTRSGFSLADHCRYGPEAGLPFQLMWLAVKKHKLESCLNGDMLDFWRREVGDGLVNVLGQRLAKAGGDWQGFALLPVHPWQWRSVQEQGAAAALAQGDLLFLGEGGDYYQPSQSLRTLVNVSHPEKANIKIPLNVVCTSSHRNLQDHFVCTAPAVSAWLQGIVAGDAYLQGGDTPVLLSEYAGLLYQPSEAERELGMEGLLGVIFRESVLAKLTEGQSALPFTALMLVESDGQPFIAPWLERYGVQAWVDRLLAVMLLPIWHLLCHHGIAFEAHAQNLVLIHRDGWPEKIVLRDFHEDTEFVADFLAEGVAPLQLSDIDPYFDSIPLDEGFSMASVDALRELFMDTVYVFNLADLSFLLARDCGYSEAQFWEQVCQQLGRYRASGVTAAERIDALGTEHAHIIVESLLKKKILDGGVLDYYEHRVSNALHRPEERIVPEERQESYVLR